jgi:putative ABC transport system permease protein
VSVFTRDLLRLAMSALLAHRLRSLLTALGIAVGIGAVVLLTSIGEGIHRFVLSEFTQFGTNLIAINPGRTTTHGVPGAILATVRHLTIEDALALRRLPHVLGTVPVVQGNAQVEAEGRTRRTTVLGVGSDVPRVFKFNMRFGTFLPPDDPRASRAYAVVGSTLRRELFGDRNPLGQRIRIASERYRVIGVVESKGEFLGFDLDDTVYIPTGRALDLFNREGLMEIDVLYAAGAPVDEVVEGIRRILIARHGREDFTVITQEKMLDVLGSILDILTFAVGALGGISLLVGGVGILTILTIAVTERTAEIGVLRALGAERTKILGIFLAEAAALAGVGGLAGLAAGISSAWLLGVVLPNLPVHISWPFLLAAEALALAIGLLAGVLPASHAARLDTVDALRAE